MKRIVQLLVFAVLISNTTGAFAADNEGWTSLEFLLKPTKMFRLSLRQEFRIEENFSEVDQYFTQLYLGIRPFKRAELGAGFRYIQNNDHTGKKQGYETHLRFHLDMKYAVKLSRFRVGVRLRYTNKNELERAEADCGKQHLRFKLRLKYNIRRWKLDPIFSSELFYALEEGPEAAGVDKMRFTIGTQYKLGAMGKIGLYYRYEIPIDQSNEEPSNIFLLRYEYAF